MANKETALAKTTKETTLAHPIEFSSEQVRLLSETVAKGCDQSELGFFLNVCKLKRLDPFTGQVHAVKRWDSSLRREKLVIQVGIDGYRVVAVRSGELAGISEPEYDSEETEHPNWARVTVWRYGRDNEKIPYTAKARWSEYVQTYKDKDSGKIVVNSMWSQRGFLMLGKCFTPDTQVLTDKGFQRFDSVTGRIMQVTEVGLEPTSSTPFSQDYSGPMIASHGDMLNFSVTPNHDMVTTVGKVEAGAMFQTARTRPMWFIPLTIEGIGEEVLPIPDADLCLAGAVAADGWHNGHRKFSVSVSKPRKIAMLRGLSPASEGVQHSRGSVAVTEARSIVSNFDKAVFTFDAERLAALMNEGKDFKSSIVLLNRRQARLLLDTWQFCDGYTNKKTGVRRLYTSRSEYLGVIELLAVIAGYSVSVPKPRTSDISDRDNFAITISEPAPAPVVLPTGDQPGLVMERNETGKVWCCTVPSGKIVVRREGFSMICGNCAEALALRKAFPDELSGMYSDEEMGQADNDAGQAPPPAKPAVSMPKSTDEKPAQTKPAAQPAQTAPPTQPAQTAPKPVDIAGVIEKTEPGKGRMEGCLFLIVDQKVVGIPKEMVTKDMEPSAKIALRATPNSKGNAFQAIEIIKVEPEIIDAEVIEEQPDILDEARQHGLSGLFDDEPQQTKPQTKMEPEPPTGAAKKGTIGVKRAQRLYTLRGQNEKQTGLSEAKLKEILHKLPIPIDHLSDLETSFYGTFEQIVTGEEDWRPYLD